jgi:hypothetical protein
MGNEQLSISNEQWAMSNEQLTMGNEQSMGNRVGEGRQAMTEGEWGKWEPNPPKAESSLLFAVNGNMHWPRKGTEKQGE